MERNLDVPIAKLHSYHAAQALNNLMPKQSSEREFQASVVFFVRNSVSLESKKDEVFDEMVWDLMGKVMRQITDFSGEFAAVDEVRFISGVEAVGAAWFRKMSGVIFDAAHQVLDSFSSHALALRSSIAIGVGVHGLSALTSGLIVSAGKIGVFPEIWNGLDVSVKRQLEEQGFSPAIAKFSESRKFFDDSVLQPT